MLLVDIIHLLIWYWHFQEKQSEIENTAVSNEPKAQEQMFEDPFWKYIFIVIYHIKHIDTEKTLINKTD